MHGLNLFFMWCNVVLLPVNLYLIYAGGIRGKVTLSGAFHAFVQCGCLAWTLSDFTRFIGL